MCAVRTALAGGRAAPHEAVVCDTPAGLAAGAYNVSVSLNAQQYTSDSEGEQWWPPTTVPLSAGHRVAACSLRLAAVLCHFLSP